MANVDTADFNPFRDFVNAQVPLRIGTSDNPPGVDYIWISQGANRLGVWMHKDAFGAIPAQYDGTAGENISTHRVVKRDSDDKLYYADHTDGEGHIVVGISTHAAVPDDPLNVQTSGPIQFGGWAWTPSLSVFVSTNGTLTQTPPASGYVLSIGRAITTNIIDILIGKPIQRA